MAGNSNMAQTRSATSSAPSGSQTVVQHLEQSDLPSATLRLRGPSTRASRRIQWAEDVVDNEGMGKKSSKVCCIYHKPHEPDDSDSSSSSSESDSEPDLSRARKVGDSGKKRRTGKGKDHDHGHGKDGGRAPSPNAYERQPKHTKTSAG